MGKFGSAVQCSMVVHSLQLGSGAVHCGRLLHCSLVVRCSAASWIPYKSQHFAGLHCSAGHYVFRSSVALLSFRLKLCSVKYIVQCGS